MSCASAETISQALVQAYGANPSLQQRRANVRAADENVGIAFSGFRPKVNAVGTAGALYLDSRVENVTSRATLVPRTYGFTVQQNLFDGGRTFNSVRQAESQVFGARETMREVEQNTLLGAAASYMNVLRDAAVVRLRRSNTLVLQEQLRQTRERFRAGDVTVTDVWQAEAALANARSDVDVSEANLQNSRASYRQVVGREPRNLEPAKSVENLLPRKLDDAVQLSQVEHPAIAAALHDVDAAELAVKIAEGALLPNVSLTGNVSQAHDIVVARQRLLNVSVGGAVTVPLYQGGGEYASIRRAKEQVSETRLGADVVRDQVRAALVSAWGQLEASKAQIASAQVAARAAELALDSIRTEARAGQRTTFDILTAQQTLLNARVTLVGAQRDRVVTSYSVLASLGRLNPETLALSVDTYDPTVHFEQVKGKPFGTRTADGR